MGIDAAGSDPLWVKCTSAGAAVEATAVAELSHASDGEQALAFHSHWRPEEAAPKAPHPGAWMATQIGAPMVHRVGIALDSAEEGHTLPSYRASFRRVSFRVLSRWRMQVDLILGPYHHVHNAIARHERRFKHPLRIRVRLESPTELDLPNAGR